MKKLSIDQWMGVVLALMGVGVLVLSAFEAGHGFGSVAPIAHGKPMPAVEGHALDGQLVSMKPGETGGKVVLLDFWATWCPPCRAELPKLADLHQRYKDKGLRFYAVNTDDAGSQKAQAVLVSRFLESKGLKLPVILDDGLLQNRFKIDSLPTMFLVGKNGMIRKVYIGLTSESTIQGDLETALAAHGGTS